MTKSKETKSDVWDLEVIVRETHRVAFTEPVILAEAIRLYMEDQIEDVLDVTNTTVLEVLDGS